MSVEFWKSLDKNFNTKKYLYHYTNVTKAIKILCSQKLIFSPLTNMNDTSEYKARIAVDFTSLDETNKTDVYEALDQILDYINSNAQNIKLLAFSQDMDFREMDHSGVPHYDDHERFFDLTGRGCALPRMWAQYASNNEGVCLIFDKEKLLEEASKNPYLISKSVEYKDYFEGCPLSAKKILNFSSQIKQPRDLLPFSVLFNENEEFIRLNYFVKLKDWQNENEFRILALHRDELALENIYNFLLGVVVGEKNDPAFTNVIKLILKEQENGEKQQRIGVKEIEFGNRICRFKE